MAKLDGASLQRASQARDLDRGDRAIARLVCLEDVQATNAILLNGAEAIPPVKRMAMLWFSDNFHAYMGDRRPNDSIELRPELLAIKIRANRIFDRLSFISRLKFSASDVPSMKSGEALFPELVFAGVVSLGGNCETAHWLRAHGRLGARGPFDWLVTPLDALPNIMADDGARLGTTFALANDGTSVRCGAYGVLYHHEFPRAERHAVRFDVESAAACRSKLAHKWASFVAACEGAAEDGAPMLFLRLWGGTDLSWDRIGHGKAHLRATDLNAVTAALTTRFPRLDFRLLVLLPVAKEADAAFDATEALDPRVTIRPLTRGIDPAWATAEADWRDLLTTLRFRDPPVMTRLDETLHWSGEAEAVQ